jgi:hypothetical protein
MDISCHHTPSSRVKQCHKRETEYWPALSVPGKRLADQRSHDGLDQGCLELKSRLPSQQAWDIVLEAFKEHLTQEVKQEMRKANNDLIMIPGGIISQIQVLDVVTNKPFKDHIQQL